MPTNRQVDYVCPNIDVNNKRLSYVNMIHHQLTADHATQVVKVIVSYVICCIRRTIRMRSFGDNIELLQYTPPELKSKDDWWCEGIIPIVNAYFRNLCNPMPVREKNKFHSSNPRDFGIIYRHLTSVITWINFKVSKTTCHGFFLVVCKCNNLLVIHFKMFSKSCCIFIFEHCN